MKILYGKIMVVMILLTNNISLWGGLNQERYIPYLNNFRQGSNFQLLKSGSKKHPEQQSKPDSAIIKNPKLLPLGDTAKPFNRDSDASTQKREARLAQKRSKQDDIDLSETFMANDLDDDLEQTRIVPTSKQIFAQAQISHALRHELSLIKDKLETPDIKDYIDKSSFILKTNFENVPDQIIAQLAPIYTIGFVNNSPSRQVNVEKISLRSDWQSEKAGEAIPLDRFIAGVDALQLLAKQQPIDLKSYMSSDKTMKDYTNALKSKFPDAPIEVLEQYVRAQLQAKKSGQATWALNIWTAWVHASYDTFTPKEIADEIVTLPQDTKLGDLSPVEKIYGLLTSIKSILKANNEGQLSALATTIGSHVIDVARKEVLDLAKPVTTPITNAAANVGKQISAATTVAQGAITAAQENINQTIVQPIASAAETVSNTAKTTVKAASNYIKKAQETFTALQKQQIISDDIEQHEPALKELLKSAINNRTDNDGAVQAAIAYIKTVVSKNEHNLSPETITHLKSVLRKLEPNKQAIISPQETFLAKTEETRLDINPRQKQTTPLELVDKIIELDEGIDESVDKEKPVEQKPLNRKTSEQIDLADTFLSNIFQETEPKQVALPSAPRAISSSAAAETVNSNGTKNPAKLRTLLTNLGNWISKTFGLSKAKVDADLKTEIEKPNNFANASSPQDAAQKYSIWLPQFIQRMLESSKNAKQRPNQNHEQNITVVQQ